MKNNFIISEQEKNRILEMHAEPKEGIFTPIKSTYQGLKGVWRGEGYDYYKYLNELGDITSELKRLDKPNQKIMSRLGDLKTNISTSKMPQDKKDLISQHIDSAIGHFQTYERYVDAIYRAVKTKLK
jgi:hypothetical protein